MAVREVITFGEAWEMMKYLVTLVTIKSMANKVTIKYLVPLEMTPSLVVQAMILLSALLPVTMSNKP
ncbi:hypothetical protein BAZSYMA_ACONTIG24851_6 [Bathymodiolus azoricus thioautotrophic gill symbiont]|uniref:Uncharacterized protein n=1 Tax=Bathymodiolus azoricus thioautotrophic gill symbiont TaxID=235205 RepID=A0A1H6LGA1_9GAMM|nr:hypothetical protein BAZSYMA_ACONTIG24851_6 [Bathymodiolus azoricus thioautotrophic gill symbiont]